MTLVCEQTQTALAAYVAACGGEDRLEYETSEAATAAARKIRASLSDNDGLTVSASYNVVWLRSNSKQEV